MNSYEFVLVFQLKDFSLFQNCKFSEQLLIRNDLEVLLYMCYIMLLKLWFYTTKAEELNLRNLKINSKAYEEVRLWKIYETSSFGIMAREHIRMTWANKIISRSSYWVVGRSRYDFPPPGSIVELCKQRQSTANMF